MEGKTTGPEKEPPGVQRTRFERIQLPEGQLSVVHPLPQDFPLDFINQLTEEEPWNKVGKILDTEGRKPELFDIAGVPVVKKRSRWTGKQVKRSREVHTPEEAKRETNVYTPSAQMAIVDEAKRRYKEAYGEDFPSLEEPLAFYIDRETTQKFTFYRYYEEINPKEWSSRYQAIRKKAGERVLRIDEKLRAIGIDRYEGGNFIIVEDADDENGFKVVLIDTEFWELAKR